MSTIYMWRIDYDNDTGPNDEGDHQWWTVTNNDMEFDCTSRHEAEWLCKVLNDREVDNITDSVRVIVAGSPFTCACGCEAFHHPNKKQKLLYQCNHCDAQYLAS